MVIPFTNALQSFLTLWSMLPLPFRAFCVLVLVVWLAIGILDLLTTRT